MREVPRRIRDRAAGWTLGDSPEKIASFGMDAQGELLLVGYEGTIFRVILDDSRFE